jgi:hypothetical protein
MFPPGFTSSGFPFLRPQRDDVIGSGSSFKKKKSLLMEKKQRDQPPGTSLIEKHP